MTQIEDLVERIKLLPRKSQTLLIAIDGRGGSGKSTLANKISENLMMVDVVHLDDFGYPDIDYRRFLDQVIIPLEQDKIAKYQHFDWGSKKLAGWSEILPRGIVIVEGFSSLSQTLWEHYDYRIWIECSAEIGFQRGLNRDLNVYHVDTKKHWLDVWMPQEKKFIEEQQPQKHADFIFDGTFEI